MIYKFIRREAWVIARIFRDKRLNAGCIFSPRVLLFHTYFISSLESAVL